MAVRLHQEEIHADFTTDETSVCFPDLDQSTKSVFKLCNSKQAGWRLFEHQAMVTHARMMELVASLEIQLLSF